MERASGLISSPPRVIQGITLKFPAKLWRIINRCISGAVSWNNNGTAIIIRRELFEDEFLSVNGYFKTTNFTSFVRQLNIYGFRKLITRQRWFERDSIFEYYHPCFQRGHPELLPNVVRNATKAPPTRDMKKATEDLQQHTASSSRLNKVIFIEDMTRPKMPSLGEAASGPYEAHHSHLKPRFSGRVHLKPPREYGGQAVSSGSMPRISPTRLHQQVAGVVPSMEASDEDNEISGGFQNSYARPTEALYVKIEKQETVDDCETLRSHQDNYQQGVPDLYPVSVHKNMKFDAIVKSPELEPLSQSSSDSESPSSMELMFSSFLPQDDQDTDCLTNTLRDSFEANAQAESSPEDSCNLHCPNPVSTTLMPTDSDLDSYPFPLGDTLLEYNDDDMGVFTPAYFNPSTGMVTLLLANSADEN